MSRHEFMLPDVGEGLSEGEIVRWLVAVGESVKTDQLLVEVQTDKAIVEIPSPVSGVLVEQGGQPNDILPIGALLAAIETNEAGAVAATATTANGAGVESPLPREASTVNAAQAAPGSPGRTDLPVSTDLSVPGASGRGRTRASPATRKLARSLGVDLTQVAASGSRGQITNDDVQRAANAPAVSGGAAPGSPAATAPRREPASGRPSVPFVRPVRPVAPAGEDRVEALTGLRRQIALTMEHAWRTVPHIFSMDEVDGTALMQVRRVLNEELAPSGLKLSLMPFFIRAAALALRAHPRFNASLDMEAGTVTYHAQVNIGVATQTDDGLIVTVVHDADQMGLADIGRRVDELAALARDRRVTLAHLSGATFSISNYGSYGGHMGTPIVRPPECAIAGFGRVRDAVVPVDGVPAVQPILPYCVSADHRLNDGADLGAFAATMVRYLVEPVRLLAVS
jgi:pyruvate dehydrogenase E2 component (dihydrolipoamide acetyltransferase)